MGHTSPRDTQFLSVQGFGGAQGLSEKSEHPGSGNSIKKEYVSNDPTSFPKVPGASFAERARMRHGYFYYYKIRS